MLLNCGVKRRLLRVPWTARRSNQFILKEISPEYSFEGLMVKLIRQYFGYLMRRADSFAKTLMLEKIEGRRRRGCQRMRWLDGIIDSVDIFEQTPGDGEGPGSLVCCSPCDCKESDMTEILNNNSCYKITCHPKCLYAVWCCHFPIKEWSWILVSMSTVSLSDLTDTNRMWRHMTCEPRSNEAFLLLERYLFSRCCLSGHTLSQPSHHAVRAHTKWWNHTWALWSAVKWTQPLSQIKANTKPDTRTQVLSHLHTFMSPAEAQTSRNRHSTCSLSLVRILTHRICEQNKMVALHN